MKQALEVIDFQQVVPAPEERVKGDSALIETTSQYQRSLLDANDKYVIEGIELKGQWRVEPENRMEIFVLIDGQCTMSGGGEEVKLRSGTSVLVPSRQGSDHRGCRPVAAHLCANPGITAAVCLALPVSPQRSKPGKEGEKAGTCRETRS